MNELRARRSYRLNLSKGYSVGSNLYYECMRFGEITIVPPLYDKTCEWLNLGNHRYCHCNREVSPRSRRQRARSAPPEGRLKNSVDLDLMNIGNRLTSCV